MTYLIVGLDPSTFAPWHNHVLAGDLGTATRIARERAAAQGIRLHVVAVIGPNSTPLTIPGADPRTGDGRGARRQDAGWPRVAAAR